MTYRTTSSAGLASLAGTCLLLAAGLAPALAETVALEPRPGADAAAICQLAGAACTGVDDVTVLSAPGGSFYAIFAAAPAFAVLEEADAILRLDQLLDLSARPSTLDEELSPARWIEPAFYDDGSGPAIALLTRISEGYAGGGGTYLLADFVRVADGTVLFSDVPMSCARTVRACFTPEEYETSPHCHDEFDGEMTVEPASPRWRFRWHQTRWPAHVDQRDMTVREVTFEHEPGRSVGAGGGIFFCEGPLF